LLFFYREPEILVKLLIDLFGLFISLQMPGGRESNFNSKQVIQFFYERHYKLRLVVRDNLCRKAIMFLHVVQKESDHFLYAYFSINQDKINYLGY